MEESEGKRRDGAWEHAVLQQRAAGEAALHEPPHVCLLMHQLPANALCVASIYCGDGALPEYTEAPEEYPTLS